MLIHVFPTFGWVRFDRSLSFVDCASPVGCGALERWTRHSDGVRRPGDRGTGAPLICARRRSDGSPLIRASYSGKSFIVACAILLHNMYELSCGRQPGEQFPSAMFVFRELVDCFVDRSFCR